jgi:hypothetical protein
MHRNVLCAAIAIAVAGVCGVTDSVAKDTKSKAGHKFKGSVEVQYRTNKNIGLAPASSGGFDFASLSEFGIDDEDEAGEEDEDDDDFDDAFDDLVDVDPDEDDIVEDDATDEDGDGIDDLLDPDADILSGSEDRFTTRLGLSHRYGFSSGKMAWNNALRLSTDTHQRREELDKFNYALTTGLEFGHKKTPHKFKPSLSWVTLEKNDRRFVSTFVVSLAYSYEVSKQLSVGATYNYQDKDLSSPTSPDARVDTLALSADVKATDDDIFKLKYAPKVEDSTEVTRNTDASGFEVTYTRKLPWEMTAGIGYRFDSVEYENLQPRRKDESTTWGAQLTREFGKQFAMELGFERRERESNIPGKDAENDSVYLGATYSF